jgi:hypothetical protein
MKDRAGIIASIITATATAAAAISSFAQLTQLNATERAALITAASLISYGAIAFWAVSSQAAKAVRATVSVTAFAVITAAACRIYALDLEYRHVVVTHGWAAGRGTVTAHAPRAAADIQLDFASRAGTPVHFEALRPDSGSSSQDPQLVLVNSAIVRVFSFRRPQSVTVTYRSSRRAVIAKSSPSESLSFIDTTDATRRLNMSIWIGVLSWIVVSGVLLFWLSRSRPAPSRSAGFATPVSSSTQSPAKASPRV